MPVSWWFTFLYQPLFNALIWIYSHVAGYNLGWAVIWLTIFLRVALLPLTVVSERNATRRQRALREAEAAISAFKNDVVKQKEVTRAIVRKYKISPWAKVLSLGIQALVLVLLYQVFIRGVTGDKIAPLLYPGIQFPGKINTLFYGFEIGARHTLWWPGLVAVYLFVFIIISERQQGRWRKSDLYYVVLFPLLSLAALWYLPMVKSLFILTTMVFSDSIRLARYLINFLFGAKPAAAGP